MMEFLVVSSIEELIVVILEFLVLISTVFPNFFLVVCNIEEIL